jgi:hypothetical protein
MPDLNDAHADFINRDHSFFTGEPNRKLIQPKEGEENAEEPPAEEANEDDEGKENNSDMSEAEEVKVPAKDLTEIDRLRFVVCAIENDC